MRVVVYDKKPGPGLMNFCLSLSWLVGAWLQKVLGAVDVYYGAKDWKDASQWLLAQPGTFTSVQYWGHGSPGVVWAAESPVPWLGWLQLKPKMAPGALLWFRVCSAFQGKVGQKFSGVIADGLGCTVAGHTRVIGLVQGGLHTRTPNTPPSWPETDTEFPETLLSSLVLKWGNNSIWFWTTKIPGGW